MFGGSYKKLMPLSNQLEGPILIAKQEIEVKLVV